MEGNVCFGVAQELLTLIDVEVHWLAAASVTRM
jgi:hypothetical protein